MANHYQTIALSSGGVTQTKNVATGDTLYITAVPPSYRTNPTPQIFVQTTNCSSNVASDSSSPYNFTITNFTSSTYSAYIFFADSDSSTTVYQGTVSGSVSSASVTAPTASSVTFDNPASANTTATVTWNLTSAATIASSWNGRIYSFKVYNRPLTDTHKKIINLINSVTNN